MSIILGKNERMPILHHLMEMMKVCLFPYVKPSDGKALAQFLVDLSQDKADWDLKVGVDVAPNGNSEFKFTFTRLTSRE